MHRKQRMTIVAAAGGNRWAGSPRLPRQMAVWVAAAALLLAPALSAERTHLKPGWNMFSPQQDVELGRKVSQDAERQLPMLNDSRVDDYLNGLGRKLAAHAPGARYPYQFKCVNSSDINAFALPGGFVYINRGVIEAADDEAQLAGVMAHEISHVALRHGTNQASKAYLAQFPLAILGGVLGGNSVGGLLAQLGAGFAVNSILLKYSRTAESQADVMGTQILYDSGYDPRAMAQFFEKIETESKGRQPMEFFSNHPNPGHRIERVDEELDNLGGLPKHYTSDTAQFHEIRRYVRSLPPPPKDGRRQGEAGPSQPPQTPSREYRSFQNNVVAIRYPADWTYRGGSSEVRFTPEGGIVRTAQGGEATAYGVIVGVFDIGDAAAGQTTLRSATARLIEELKRSNPALQSARDSEATRVGGRQALSTYLSNESPVQGRERDWLVTVLEGAQLYYFICVAPQNDFDRFSLAFQTMISSVRFSRAR